MMNEEGYLKYLLNYTYKEDDFFIRTDAIMWFQITFIQYWRNIDKKENSNYLDVIKMLYQTDNNDSFQQKARVVGLHVRTLTRYRHKFVASMNKMIKEYQEEFFMTF